MRILLDECVPQTLRKLLPMHQCLSTQTRGWGGIKNGDLLARAEIDFDVFITADQNIRYQQNLAGRRISIIQLSTNKWRDLQAAAALIRSEVAAIKPGELRTVVIPRAK